MNLVSCFIDDFLFTSFSQKNEIKKGKYPTGIHNLLFRKQMNDLFDVRMHRFQNKFGRW